jgi:haloalkane dehalogenase
MGWKELYPFESHYLDVSGGRLHYVDQGSGDPILFVHGNPTWSFYWRRLIQAFSPQFRCIALDHLGCGLSDKPESWSYQLADHIANLEALILKLDLKKITLVVHDWGGAIGLGAAGKHPERFARLGILNTAAFPASRIPLRIAVCRIPGVGALGVRGLNGFAQAAVYMATEKGLAPEVAAGLLAPYDSWANRIATLRFVEDIPMDSGHRSWPAINSVAEKLPLLAHCPTRLIWGEKDWCFTPWFREEFQRRMPWAEAVPLSDAGHYVVEDAPEAVEKALKALLNQPISSSL